MRSPTYGHQYHPVIQVNPSLVPTTNIKSSQFIPSGGVSIQFVSASSLHTCLPQPPDILPRWSNIQRSNPKHSSSLVPLPNRIFVTVRKIRATLHPLLHGYSPPAPPNTISQTLGSPANTAPLASLPPVGCTSSYGKAYPLPSIFASCTTRL